MSLLFPFFISVVMLLGPNGTMVPDHFGPFDTKEEAEHVAYFLRYQAGMETGEIERKWRWINASSLTDEGKQGLKRWFDALEKRPIDVQVQP